KAQPFKLPGVDGKHYSLEDFSDKNILVIIFMCNHCPYVKAVIDRIIEIDRDYAGQGVQMVGINSNEDVTYPDDSFDAMKVFAKKKKIRFPYLRDESQEVAHSYDAVCTPDIFVYDTKRTLVYRGRIDDNWQDVSKTTSHDLRDALSALISGKKPAEHQHPSMGCSIKWK
ncbi:thioredoxin family protein, partial [Candidatus Peregrinibacteria bacterium]|nr:thioredoxin family protein [Candidatus Peregrinibacteria bacterium]